MSRAASLRLRLTVIILTPVLSIAVIAGLWQLNNARATATEVFDRSLLSAALAVAHDVAISEGDALSARTRDILASTSGGQVFYHVYAPDGVIVAGYATPPVGIPRPETDLPEPLYFKARYQSRAVSGVRLQNRAEIDGFSGTFTTTVWQDLSLRQVFVRDLILRTFVVIASLTLSLGLIVWFGIRIGLRPLTNLEEAIAARSGTDLSPIQRSVPPEVQGIVGRLNLLFGQVSQTMSAQRSFIANAAHQLRNPIAGVLSLAESVANAPTEAAARSRAQDLLDAARETSALSQKLLMLERAEAISPEVAQDSVDLGAMLPVWTEGLRQGLPDSVELALSLPQTSTQVRGEATMLREALRNLVDNAVLHGGPGLRQITVALQQAEGTTRLSVQDDGRGLPSAVQAKALERFGMVSETSRSGLGLSIVQAIARGHGGEVTLTTGHPGLNVTLSWPQ